MKTFQIALFIYFCLLVQFAEAQNNISSSGFVGIGITQPYSPLHVKNDLNSSQENWIIRIQNDNAEYGALPTSGMLFAVGDMQSQKAGIIFRRTGPYGIGNMYFLNNGNTDPSLPTINNNTLMTLHSGGNVGIGTTTPSDKLSVNGKIRAHEIKVETANWPDYVFAEDYKITGLKALEKYIQVHKHLPEMPSAKEVEQNGVALGDMVKLQQKKIEELTLHLIEKDKQLQQQQKQINQILKSLNNHK